MDLIKLHRNISSMNAISPVSYALYSGDETIYLPQELEGLKKKELSAVSAQSYAVKHIKDLR